MTEKQLSAAVAKYGKKRLAGMDPADLRKEIEADDKIAANMTPADIEAVYEGAMSYEGDEGAGSGAGSKGDKPKTLNLSFDEHRVENDVIEHEASEGKNAWTEHRGYIKGSKIRTTSITEDRAKDLNAQSSNSLVRLYYAGTDKAPDHRKKYDGKAYVKPEDQDNQ